MPSAKSVSFADGCKSDDGRPDFHKELENKKVGKIENEFEIRI